MAVGIFRHVLQKWEKEKGQDYDSLAYVYLYLPLKFDSGSETLTAS